MLWLVSGGLASYYNEKSQEEVVTVMSGSTAFVAHDRELSIFIGPSSALPQHPGRHAHAPELHGRQTVCNGYVDGASIIYLLGRAGAGKSATVDVYFDVTFGKEKNNLTTDVTRRHDFAYGSIYHHPGVYVEEWTPDHGGLQPSMVLSLTGSKEQVMEKKNKMPAKVGKEILRFYLCGNVVHPSITEGLMAAFARRTNVLLFSTVANQKPEEQTCDEMEQLQTTNRGVMQRDQQGNVVAIPTGGRGQGTGVYRGSWEARMYNSLAGCMDWVFAFCARSHYATAQNFSPVVGNKNTNYFYGG